MDAGAGAGVGDGMGGGSVYLSILGGTCTCTVPKGPLRASTFFWRGSFCFFFLDRVGELAAAEEEKVFWFFLYLPFFGGGVFGTAAAGFYLALSLSSSFPGGRVWKRV